MINKFSIGNMGGSTVVCKQEKIGIAKQLVLSCPIGTEMLQSSIIFGAMNQDLNQLNYCLESKIWENSDNSDNTNCTA